jgi:hypothetical protein
MRNIIANIVLIQKTIEKHVYMYIENLLEHSDSVIVCCDVNILMTIYDVLERM